MWVGCNSVPGKGIYVQAVNRHLTSDQLQMSTHRLQINRAVSTLLTNTLHCTPSITFSDSPVHAMSQQDAGQPPHLLQDERGATRVVNFPWWSAYWFLAPDKHLLKKPASRLSSLQTKKTPVRLALNV